MKNMFSVFALFLIFNTSHLHAQTWKTFKIDKKTSIKTPSDARFSFQKTAESSTHIISTKDGTIMIMKMALPKGATSENVQINVETNVRRVEEKEAEDIDFNFEGRKKTVEENEEMEEESELKTETASAAVKVDGVQGQAMINKIEVAEDVFMWQRSLTFVHNNALYVFTYMQSASGEEYVSSETANQFFNSISFKKKKKSKKRR